MSRYDQILCNCHLAINYRETAVHDKQRFKFLCILAKFGNEITLLPEIHKMISCTFCKLTPIYSLVANDDAREKPVPLVVEEREFQVSGFGECNFYDDCT